MLDALVAVPVPQATRPRLAGRATSGAASAQRPTCSAGTRRHSVTCGVQCPGSACGNGPGAMCGRHSRVHVGLQRQQFGGRHDQPHQRERPVPEQHRSADRAGQRQPAATPAQQRRRPRRRCARRRQASRAAGCSATRRPPGCAHPHRSGRPRSARIDASVSGSKSSSTEWTSSADQARDPIAGRTRLRSSTRTRRRSARPRPSGSTARTGASRRKRVAVVRLCTVAGCARPRADHQSGTRNICASKRFHRQRGVVQRAQTRLRRRPAPARPGRPRGHAASPRRHRSRRAGHPRPRPGSAAPAGPRSATSAPRSRSRSAAAPRLARRPRRAPAAREALPRPCNSVTPESRADLGEIVVTVGGAGLHRLAHRDVDARQPRMARQRGGRHRLADAGVGARDDEDAHAAQPSTSTSVSTRTRERHLVVGQRRARRQPQPRRARGHRRRAEAAHPHAAVQACGRRGQRHLGRPENHRHHGRFRLIAARRTSGPARGVRAAPPAPATARRSAPAAPPTPRRPHAGASPVSKMNGRAASIR